MVSLLFISACSKQEAALPLAHLTTSNVTEIEDVTAKSGGAVSSNGGSVITAQGVCWSKTPSPTINDSKTSDGTGRGTFVSTLTGLNVGTSYYVRAYATNSAGTGYGITRYFETKVSDIDGNVYQTVPIGSQLWLAENLKVTKLKDGTAITLVEDNAVWGYQPTGYFFYNNDAPTYEDTYGALYNWYTVNTGKLCPAGWHVPTDAEWTTLTTYLGGLVVAGGKLKEKGLAHWQSPNEGATNEGGFTALPGGGRGFDGTFFSVGEGGGWWSSSEANTGRAWGLFLNNSNGNVYRNNYGKEDGFSVRCIRN